MTKMKIFQVDAFTDTIFSGNPAAVCPLSQWLPDDLMQKIAAENNLSETAFYIKQDDEYHIRWFTPAVEVALCGHATLASAYVLFHHEGHQGDVIHLQSHLSGKLTVTRHGEMLTLNFPSDPPEPVDLTREIAACFNIQPQQAFKGKTDLLLLFNNEAEILSLVPDFGLLSMLDARGIIVTARGNSCDFVSRFFAPKVGVSEDPVTGSAHTTLTPFWSEKLGKVDLTAVQLSARRGNLRCKLLYDRVEICGQCRLFLLGEIFID